MTGTLGGPTKQMIFSYFVVFFYLMPKDMPAMVARLPLLTVKKAPR
jgi:hypothetical protein